MGLSKDQAMEWNMERKIDEWEKSQNLSSKQTDRTDPLPPHTHTEQVNVQVMMKENAWRTSILINGSPTSKSSLKRGLSQGDPLSPFLFIIVMEGLYMALNDGLATNMFHGVKVGSPVRVSSNEVEIMASYTGCEAGFFPFTYLGLPIGSNGSSEDSKKLAWVKWSNIFASFDKGGLGVGSLKAFNMSLLLKWRWRHFHNLNALWFHVVKTIHGDEADWSRLVNVGRTKAEFNALIFYIASLEPEVLVYSDICIWRLSHDDKFSVNSIRKHIDELSLPSLSPSTRRCKIIPRKNQVPTLSSLVTQLLLFGISFVFGRNLCSLPFPHVASGIFGFSHGTPQRKRRTALTSSLMLLVGPYGGLEIILLSTLII
ncbi:hypothetical protein Tco_0628399 [Tanacetum coccineum]|uniref:Reverse transcriptase domain-containing protein n=1 Tax=Tanacetum coccineum TaxID=301880 RepID=A0ABQ4WQ74_9ASTR